MPPCTPRESTVEAAFVRQLRARGLTVVKLNLTGRRGWPDRLVLLPGGRVVFVELKRRGERARQLQEHVHAELRALGFAVQTFDDAAAAVAWVVAQATPARGIGVET